jgi:NADH:ubiquinone oxidoreductase subunit C
MNMIKKIMASMVIVVASFSTSASLINVGGVVWDPDSGLDFQGTTDQHSIRLRVGIEEDNPSVPTVSNLWKGALYPEQELFDMFGINVEGHPTMERLIMPKDWEGFPLRKDYPLTTETVAFSHNRDFKSELVKSKPPTR